MVVVEASNYVTVPSNTHVEDGLDAIFVRCLGPKSTATANFSILMGPELHVRYHAERGDKTYLSITPQLDPSLPGNKAIIANSRVPDDPHYNGVVVFSDDD